MSDDGLLPGAGPFPHLRLRDADGAMLDLPWELPLRAWRAEHFRDLRVGPSRHLVRRLAAGVGGFVLKEEPLAAARREFAVLRQLERTGLRAVAAMGLAEAPQRDSAILVTDYLAHSLPYRSLMRRSPGRSWEQLLDAMAWLLVDLHRAGVYWGDCSLDNTLFRRDGDTLQAYLVDAETSELHPQLSDGQRTNDLDILVENVAFGLADLAAEHHAAEQDWDAAIGAAEHVRERYDATWAELHAAPALRPSDRHAMRARMRRLNELGFAIDEIELDPAGHDDVILRVAVTTRHFHARALARLSGLVALENQARLLLNDLREYAAWRSWSDGRPLSPDQAADRWRTEVFEASTMRIAAEVDAGRDLVQAYCDVLEHKWLLSEAAGRDVGLAAALESYLAAGAPAPEGEDNPAEGREAST